MSSNAKVLSILLWIVALLFVGYGILKYGCNSDSCRIFTFQKIATADSFERCAELGFPVMESYPRQCKAGDKTFTENVGGVSNDMIRVTSPLANAVVNSPLVVKGEARGNWYFEASFPVRLYDANGKELVVLPAQAKGDWMTTEFVPFEVILAFGTPTTETGLLVLQKDNPSGLPEHDASVSIPVRFSAVSIGKNSGTLQGSITLGPICPVERMDQPCLPTPEMYAARKVSIYLSDKKTLVTTVIPDAKGKFSAILPAGDYWVAMETSSGVGSVQGLPALIHIGRGTTSSISVSVDTGIR